MTDELRPQWNSSVVPRHISSSDLTARRLLAAELHAGRTVGLTVATSSMAPAICPGDLLKISPCPPFDLRCGDVILFERESDWIVHRVTAVRNSSGGMFFLARGDAASCADRPVPPQNVLGRVMAVERRGIQSAPAPQVFVSADMALMQASCGFSDALINWARRRGWGRFFDDAQREGLAELIDAEFADGVSGVSVPQTVKDKFDAARRVAAVRAVLFQNVLRSALDALAGFPVIVLKGACLASAVYKSPSMRLFGDIDLLVKSDSVSAVIECLRMAQDYLPDPAPQPATINSVMLKRSGGMIAMHLHWHLFNSVRDEYAGLNLDMREIWRCARPMPGGGLMLSAEHLVMHLAEHAVRHSFDRLIWLRDIAEVVLWAGDDMRWNEFLRICHDAGLDAPAYHSLFYVGRMTPACIPDGVLEQLCPAPIRMGDRLFRRLALQGRRIPEMGLLVFMARLPHTGARLRFLWRAALPPRISLPAGGGKDNVAGGIWRVFHRIFCRGRLPGRIVLAWIINIPATVCGAWVRRVFCRKS